MFATVSFRASFEQAKRCIPDFPGIEIIQSSPNQSKRRRSATGTGCEVCHGQPSFAVDCPCRRWRDAAVPNADFDAVLVLGEPHGAAVVVNKPEDVMTLFRIDAQDEFNIAGMVTTSKIE